MLRIFSHLSELDFEKLISLYQEGNQENAREFYPHLAHGEAILRAEEDFYSYLREDFFHQKGAFYCVWEENGLYLSALRLEPCGDGLLLEALETHPDHRGKGFAKKLIRAVQSHLGKGPVYSHVSKRNEASLATHRSCGFAAEADYARYIDGSISRNACTLCWRQGE